MLVGAIVILLMMFGAVADLGMVFLIKARTQRLADAAALAGVRMCPDRDPEGRANVLVRLNALDLQDEEVVDEIVVEVTRACDEVNSQFYFGVRVSAPVRLMFAVLWETIAGGTVTVSSEAEAARGTLDLMMVFDTSGFVKIQTDGLPLGADSPPADTLSIFSQNGREIVGSLFSGGHANRIGVVRYDTFAYPVLPLSDDEETIDITIGSLPGMVAAEAGKLPFVSHFIADPTLREKDNMHWKPMPSPGDRKYGWGFDFPNLAAATLTANAELGDSGAQVKAIIFLVSSLPLQPDPVFRENNGHMKSPLHNPVLPQSCYNSDYNPMHHPQKCGYEAVLAIEKFRLVLMNYPNVYYYIVFCPGNILVANCELVPPQQGELNNCSSFDFDDPGYGYIWGTNIYWFPRAELIDQYNSIIAPELDLLVSEGKIRNHFLTDAGWDPEELMEDLRQVVHSRLVG